MPIHFTLDEWMKLNQQSAEMQNNKSASSQNQIATPQNQEEFDKLPDGAFYIEPEDGHIYQKGNKTRPRSSNPKGTLT